MDFESDPAADFLNREREMLGDLENEISNANEEQANSGPTSDDFVMVGDNDVQENIRNDNEAEDAFSGMHIAKTVSKEIPEKIRLWKERQVLMLEEKDKEEKVAIERLKEASKKELDDWYRNNQSNLEKTKANNRLHESSATESTTADSADVWKCVYNLCDFTQQKATGTKDRMKNILLQLNQTPLNKNCA